MTDAYLWGDRLTAFLCGVIGLGLPVGFLVGYAMGKGWWVFVYRHYDHNQKGGTQDP